MCARTQYPLALTCSLSLFLWDADLLGMAGPCTSSYAIRSHPKSEGYTFTLFTAPPLGTKELTSTAGVGGGAAWQETLMSCTCEEECASKGKQSHTQPLQPALCNWFNPHRDVRSLEQHEKFLRILHRIHIHTRKTMFGSNCQLHKVDRELWIKISTHFQSKLKKRYRNFNVVHHQYRYILCFSTKLSGYPSPIYLSLQHHTGRTSSPPH